MARCSTGSLMKLTVKDAFTKKLLDWCHGDKAVELHREFTRTFFTSKIGFDKMPLNVYTVTGIIIMKMINA